MLDTFSHFVWPESLLNKFNNLNTALLYGTMQPSVAEVVFPVLAKIDKDASHKVFAFENGRSKAPPAFRRGRPKGGQQNVFSHRIMSIIE